METRADGRAPVRPQNRKTLLIGLTLLAVVIGALFLFVFMTQGLMTTLRESFLSGFRDSTGYDISYDTISPSFFRYIEIRGLRINSRDSEKSTIALVGTLRLHYNLFELLFAKDKIRALEKIEAEQGFIAVDRAREKRLLGYLENLFKDSRNEYRLSPRFALSLKNINLSYQDDQSRWALENLFAALVTKGQFLHFNLHTRGDAGRRDAAAARPDVTTSLDMEGKIDTAVSRLDARFRVESLQAGGVIVKEQEFNIRLKDRVVEVTKVQDRSPLDLSLAYSLDSGRLDAGVLAENLKPASLIEFTDDLAALRPVLAATVSADGALHYASPENKLAFSLALDGFLPASVSPIALRLHSRITGTEEKMDFAPIALTSEIGKVEFTGNVVYRTLYPEGYLRFVNVKTGTGRDINADLALARTEESVTLKGEKILIGSSSFRSFILDIFPRSGAASFVVTSALDLPLPDHHINLTGEFNFTQDARLSLEGDLASVPASFFYRALTRLDDYSPLVDQSLETILWSTRCSLQTDFRTFTLSAADVAVRDFRNPRNQIVFSASVDQSELRISRFRGKWADYDLAGALSAGWRGSGEIAFSGDCSVNQEKYAWQGRYQPETGLLVSGSHDLLFMLVPQKNGGQYLALQASRLPLPVPGSTVLATLDWIGFISRERGLELVSRRTSLSNLPAPVPPLAGSTADIRFAFSDGHLDVSELVFKNPVSLLTGNGSLDLDFSPEARARGWLYLADENQVEHYTVMLDASPAQNRLDVLFEDSPIAHWGELAVRGSLSGALKLRGPFADPVVDLAFSLNHGRVNSEPLTLSGALSASSGGVKINSLESVYGNTYRFSAGRGEFDGKTGVLDFSARFSTGVQDPIEADIAFHAAVDKFNGNEPLSALLQKTIEGSMRVVGLPRKDKTIAPWEVRFSLADGEFNVAGGPDEVLLGVVHRDGSFLFDLLPPFPLQGRFAGLVRENVIDARAEDLVLLFPSLNEFIASPFFVIKDGVARGALTISGPLGDPDFFGILEVERFTASSEVLADTIGPLRSVIEVREKSLRLRETKTKIGTCPLDLAAEMTIDHWGVSRLVTRLAITDPLGARLKLPADVLSLDGYITTPGLTLTADPAGLTVAGPIFVQRCDVVLGPAKKDTTDGEDDANLVVDLAIKTGKQVEFFWPARELPVLQMVTEPGANLNVKLNKLKGEFALNGDISFKGGNVYYFERSFLIREGSLSLKETQLDFNPVLNLRAERRVRYNDKDVKITLRVPNQHLKEFAPEFDSDPPLPITERYLALGGVIQNPADAASNDYLTSIVSDVGGDVLTQLVLLRPLEDKVKELLNLDGFSIRTQFIKNLILDTVFYTEPQDSSSRPINMGRYLDNTEISFQKYLDEQNNLFFETVVRIRADLAQGSTMNLSQDFGNINVESEFSLELTTPFFLTIKWSITPEHWEQFFLPDNKITVKWGISF